MVNLNGKRYCLFFALKKLLYLKLSICVYKKCLPVLLFLLLYVGLIVM